MISIAQYDGIVFEDLETVFKKTNVDFYKYITEIGMDLDLSKKDQQKIYLHHFIVNICRVIQVNNDTTIFHINKFNMCDIHVKMIKKIKQIFGFKIWESPYSLPEFLVRLKNRHGDVVDQFEMFLLKESKPKTFKHIKKYLGKEGFTFLSDVYFQDLSNKMSVLC